MTHPWAPGSVTGIGSLPGTDPDEAARLVLGELPGFAHLPELPARGAGSDLIGRTAALLIDLPVEIVPSGWAITAHAGRDLRRARDFLERDIDALHARADGYTGALKVQAAGPWTLAAALELPSGHKAITDHGAVRDIADSLAEGLRAHVADLARRVPGARIVAQVDEPSLPAVLGGRIATPSGYGTVRAVEPARAEQVLRSVLSAAPDGARAVHCCAADVPLALLRSAGADAISLDAALLQVSHYDALGEAVDAGTALWLGVLPATGGPGGFDQARDRIRTIWSALGFPAAQLAESVVPTPACGFAGADPAYLRAALAVLRDVGAWLLQAG
ncbi:MAG: methionine synthase [Jatrophihabitantaceae bacterium]